MWPFSRKRRGGLELPPLPRFPTLWADLLLGLLCLVVFVSLVLAASFPRFSYWILWWVP